MKLTASISKLTSRKSAIVFAVSFLFCLFSLAIAPPIHAQSPKDTCKADSSFKDTRNDFNTKALSEYDSAVFNNDQMFATLDSLKTILTGCSSIHPSTNIATSGQGALTAAGGAIAMLYSAPPASGVQYLAGQFERFNPVQPAYAQEGGIGFSSLTPVQGVWSAFRNMSYIGFILIFIVIGFMVMFRSKISPQAVATVQDSLPRIVVALILVTFSYAIVGLMIDAMFVILNVILAALDQANMINLDQANKVTSSNVFSVVTNSWGSVFTAVFEAIDGLIKGVFDNNTFGKLIGAIGGTVVAIIAGIAMFVIMFRVFVMLLISYISIIILTVFAPFLLLFQALPGNNGAKEWFKQVAANLSVFPVVALMFILAGMLSGIEALGGTNASQFTEGSVGQFPLFTGGLGIKSMGGLIGIGILFMTPGAAKIVKERFGVKEGALGAGAGMAAASLGAGAKGITGPVGGFAKPYQQALGQKRFIDALGHLPEKYRTQPGIGHGPNSGS